MFKQYPSFCIPYKPFWHNFAWGVGHGVVLLGLWFLLQGLRSSFMTSSLLEEPQVALLFSPGKVLQVVVLQPLMEEWLFRVVLFTWLCWRSPFWLALLVQAICFGLLHDVSWQGLWFQWAVLAGLYLGFITHKHQAWSPGVYAHMMVNAASVLL